MCVYTGSISAMKQAHHTCQIPAHPSSRYSVSGEHWRWLQLRLREQSWLLHSDWCRYLATNSRCLHPAQHCSKSSNIIRRTLRCIPSYSKLTKTEISHPVPRVLILLYKRIISTLMSLITWREQKPVVPVLVDLHHQYEVIHHHHEVLQTPSNWYSSIVSLLISKPTNFNPSWETIS